MASNNLLAQCPGLSGLNAYLRPLSAPDVKSCVAVESTFPKHERCSEEKFSYRLHRTPELCLGLFIRVDDKDRLIGHIIANRTSSAGVTDGSMLMPSNWESLPPADPAIVDGEVIGNDPRGTSIAVHSVAIVPEYQGKRIGTLLVKAYAEYIKSVKIPAERIVLIAHGHLVQFYESVGFENQGMSPCRFAGGGWFDLALNL